MENTGVRAGQCSIMGAGGLLKQIFRVDYGMDYNFRDHDGSGTDGERLSSIPTSTPKCNRAAIPE